MLADYFVFFGELNCALPVELGFRFLLVQNNAPNKYSSYTRRSEQTYLGVNWRIIFPIFWRIIFQFLANYFSNPQLAWAVPTHAGKNCFLVLYVCHDFSLRSHCWARLMLPGMAPHKHLKQGRHHYQRQRSTGEHSTNNYDGEWLL